MSDTQEKVLVLSDHHRQLHNLPKGKHVRGHRIVVEGVYAARPPKRDDAGHPRLVKYREEFILKPHEHRLHGQGSLSHVLADKLLAERLTKKDPEFRSVRTHKVVEHENLLVDAAAAAEGGKTLLEKVAGVVGLGPEEEAPAVEGEQEEPEE